MKMYNLDEKIELNIKTWKIVLKGYVKFSHNGIFGKSYTIKINQVISAKDY